jgi:hypothetical protein
MEQHLTALERLGPPDEIWSAQEVPTLSDGATRLTFKRSIALPDGYGPGELIVAQTEQERELIIGLVDDEPDRNSLRNIDLTQQTILMITGVPYIEGVSRAQIQELASPSGDEPIYRLDLTIDGLRRTPAVIAVISRLPVRPHEALIHHPGAGSIPDRFLWPTTSQADRCSRGSAARTRCPCCTTLPDFRVLPVPCGRTTVRGGEWGHERR